jgi:hypothetical protein
MPDPNTTTQTNPTTMAVTYSEAKDLRKGEELMIFVGDNPIAYTTSHTLDTTVDTKDVSSKMSGDYDSSMPGKISWSISIEALTSTTTGHQSKDELMKALVQRKPIRIMACDVTRGVDTTGAKTFAKGTIHYQGDCIITKLNEKSTNGEYESFSCELKGTGPLLDGAGKPLGEA